MSDMSHAEVARALAGASSVPYWLDDPTRPAARPALRGAHRAQLAIVGGGFTGLWTAVLAKERDPDCEVMLVEGGRIGWAASGRNGGFCSASLTHGWANGQAHLPHENARLDELGRENLQQIARAVERYGIDCDFELTGEIALATEPHQVEALRAEHNPDAGVEWLEGASLERRFRSPHVLGGLFERDGNALINPARLCWELARVAEELGVRIFEGTPVRSWSARSGGADVERGGSVRSAASHIGRLLGSGAGARDRGPVVLHTDSGTIEAEAVALGTNVFPSLLRAQRLRTVPVYDYALMSEPLTAAQMDAIGWSGREGLADTNNRFHYFRLTRDNRILWGGFDAVYYYGRRLRRAYDQRRETFETLVRNFDDMFPALRGIRFTHAWGGAIDSCTRFFPFFATGAGGRIAYTAGFTGLGVGASRFAGEVMLDLLSGEETELTAMDYVRRRPLPFPPEPFAWLGIKATTAALIRADAREGRRGPLLRALDACGVGFNS